MKSETLELIGQISRLECTETRDLIQDTHTHRIFKVRD